MGENGSRMRKFLFLMLILTAFACAKREKSTAKSPAAEKTRGKFYAIGEADNLLKDLPVGARVRMKAPPSAAWTWWSTPMFFLAALLALTTEWVLRKQKNLV